MATNVDVPALGESVREAILVKWHKNDGDAVAAAEPIAELETDKANVDVPAKTSGILHHLKEAGETVNVGEAIARIDEGPAGSRGAPDAAVGHVGAVAAGHRQGLVSVRPRTGGFGGNQGFVPSQGGSGEMGPPGRVRASRAPQRARGGYR